MSKKPLVLVVDDLKSNRMVIKKVLQNNYDFIEASDGKEALNMLKNYNPMIILIDAIMPNLDGFDTIKKIRENPKYKRTPILMITSLSDIKIKVKALEYGVNDFLTKPFDKYELRARCKSYVEMVILNKQFSDAKINPISKFKNEIALIKDIKPNHSIFLFSINDFHKIEGIYGYKNRLQNDPNVDNSSHHISSYWTPSFPDNNPSHKPCQLSPLWHLFCTSRWERLLYRVTMHLYF